MAPRISRSIQRALSRHLSQLDALVEAYIENQLVLTGLAAGGTLLFLFFFLVFTGAFGLVVLTGLVIGLLEAGLTVGLTWMYGKYGAEDAKDRRVEIADVIEAHVTRSDFFSDWDEFLANPVDDPKIEQIRLRCKGLGEEFPPEIEGDYCGPGGIEALESYVNELRAGAVTKFFEAIQERRERAETTRQEEDDEDDEEETVGSMLDTPDDVGVVEPQPSRKEKKKKAARKRAKRKAKAASIDELEPDEDVDLARSVGLRPTPRVEPAPAPPKRLRRGEMTEAGAIQKVMTAGFTAHDYDRIQQTLRRENGREASPAVIVRALLGGARKSSKKQKKKKKKNARMLVREAPAPAKMRPERQRKQRRLRGVILFAGLPLIPFGAYRIPNGAPQIIQGEVRSRVLDPASDLADFARTQFESILGNKRLDLLDGECIYLSRKDYEQCWTAGRDTDGRGFTVLVTARARPLLVGGFGVAELDEIEVLRPPEQAAIAE